MLSKTFLSRMRESLLQQKKEILDATQQLEKDIDMDGDETDLIQGNMLAEMSNRLDTRNAAKLRQIEDALQRIEKQSYGLCLDCGDPISEKRLQFNPHFLTCVSCAEDREAEEKQRKRS
jgi:RNA polymerase-binding transcription factor DksA